MDWGSDNGGEHHLDLLSRASTIELPCHPGPDAAMAAMDYLEAVF